MTDGMYAFYMTRGGREFVDHTAPSLVKTINRLATAVEEQNQLIKAQPVAKKEENKNE